MISNCENMLMAASIFEEFPEIERDHRGGSEIDGFAAEVLDDLQRLGPLGVVGEELHHDQLFHDGVLAVVLGAMDHVDELADLHDDLRKPLRITGNADGHAGEIRVAAFGDDERVDVEATAGEDLADPHQDAGLVADEYGERVGRAARGGGRRDGSVGSDDGVGMEWKFGI